MRPLTQEEAVELQQQGHDPAGWVVDDATNEYVYQGVESPNALAEFGKSLIRGGGQGIGMPAQFQGRVNELIEQYTGIPMPRSVGAFGKFLTETTERMAPRGDMSDRPIAQFFAQDVGEGLGQLGTMLIPGIAATKIGSLGGKIASRVAPGLLGGLAEAEDTAARAVEEGQSPEEAIVKGLASGAVAGGLEQAIGAGRLARKITGGNGARGVGEFVKNRYGDAWRGGAEEGGARAFQDAIVSGKLSWDEILREAAVGGVLQSGVGGAIDVATRGKQSPVIDTDDFEAEGATTQTDVDITRTPWKTTPMTETYKRNLIESETWDPVIKTDFDVAVNDAKKRKILTPEIVDALYNSDKPQELLDRIVREGVQPARVVTPLDDAQIEGLRKIGPDDTPPVMTPLIQGVQAARKAGLNLDASDYQRLNEIAQSTDKPADAKKRIGEYLNQKWNEQKIAERPMTAAEAVQELRDKKYEKIRKVLPTQIGNLEKIEKNTAALSKQLEKADLTAGERWQMSQQLNKMIAEANQLRVDILREYLGEYEETPMTLEREGPPLARPPIINIDTGTPPPPPQPPAGPPPQLMPPDYTTPPEGEQRPPFAEQVSNTQPPETARETPQPAQGAATTAVADPQRTVENEAVEPAGRLGVSEKYIKDGFVLSSISELDAARPYGLDLNRQGNIPTGNLINRMRNTMPKGEVQAYEAAGLGEWLKDKRSVSREELADWLSKNGPQVEVKKLYADVDKEYAVNRRLAEVVHELDTLNPRWREAQENDAELDSKSRSLLKEYHELLGQVDFTSDGSASATRNYTQVNPKPLDQMPGAVDVLVRVPRSEEAVAQKIHPDSKDATDVLFKGGHFGDVEDINILGWCRMYQETLPDGRKGYHIFENQKDWGQPIENSDGTWSFRGQRDTKYLGKKFATAAEARRAGDEGHPLLREYQRLSLKAAIRHALDNNAEFIAISDAETAMLTERHDQYSREGKIEQEPGMRLNYDKVLPEILEELTGYKGVKESFGEHQNTQNRQNLIFKNPDGTPKTDITARVYPLTAVRKAETARKAFSLFGKDRSRVTREQMERETGLTEADLSPGAEFHSGFGGSAAAGVWRAIQKSGFGLEYVQKLTRAVKDVLALQGESGAYVAAWIQPLITEQTRLKNVSLKSAQKYEKLLKDARFIKWINHSADTKTEDYSKLPVELRAQAKRLRQHLIAYQNIQNKEGIMVQEMDLAGNKRLRPAQQLPGWFPFRIKDAVYNDFKRESHIRQRRSEWMRNAERHIGDRPNWKEQAEAAFDRIQQVNKRVDTIGEPLFKAVDTEHSWPLPPEWRDDNLTSGLYRYADKWSKHIAWEKIVGKNPILRRILNIPEGPAGELTKDDAPQKWSEVPQQYATAVEMGKRSFANWTDSVDLNRTIEPIKDPTPVNMFIASYAQKPIGAYERVNDVVNAASQLAGAMMMQTPTGLRDLGTAMTGVWGYVPLKDMARAVGGFIDAIASPVKTIEKAQKAGAAPLDVFTLQSGEAITRDFMDALTKGEAAQRVANILYKAAQTVRTFTGRNFMDSWGRAIIYNTVAEVSKYNKQHGLKDSLTEEFVPREVREKLSPQEQVDATAAAVVERLAPRYDAASLPAGMLPQNRTLLSSALSLLKFPVSRFNNWYKDEWMPAMHGKPQRLIKSLLLMGVSSQIIGELIALLTDRRPQELTWAEYLRMPEGIVENKDLAAMIFYNLQMQGYYGLAGDAANVIARRVAGRPTDLGKATELAYPPAIVWNELYPKVMSFLEAAQTGTLGVDDITQMGWEILSANQNMKVFNAWADAKPEYRDRMIFEQLYQASAKTAEPINKRTRSNFATPDPFSLNNRLMRVDDVGDLRRLLPEIQARPNPIQIQPQLMSEYYYAELAMRRGKKEALKQLEADREREEKRQLIQSLR